MKNSDGSDVHSILNHPIRRKILRLIAEKGYATFTDFKNSLNLKVGTLYYHLDNLGDFISQDDQKRYLLTSRGIEALKLMDRSEDITTTDETVLLKAFYGIGLKPIVDYILEKPKEFLPFGILIVFLLSYVTYLAELNTILLFFTESSVSLLSMVFILSFVRWFYIYLFIEIFCGLIFKRSIFSLGTLTGTLWAQFPLIFYVLLWRFGGVYRIGNDFFQLMFQLFFQIWLLLVITYVITKSKQLKIEKAFLISILIHYFNIVILQFII
ncbi:helix-turn-helix domain-containing protein [Candidatus Borrarchaeum sp.]|uniref:winged helix-turn-helix domain-containing protein n=1 Tax=Candidatus Borrarchaeum sp. TaxID=2846742 RepID=UPI00257C18B9|nr:helix-turn-helix domain-containing protein [Candidatus Borrarchaeum sp.]